MKKVSSDNQMMQPLESRRMMSTTVGIEAAPAMLSMPAASIVQVRHPQESADRPSAGIDANAIHAQQDFGGFHFGIGFGDSEDFQDQMAAAIAQGNSITISPTDNDQDPHEITPGVSKPATLSDLYAALGNSTVAEIDNAAALSSSGAKTTLIAAIQNLSSSDDSTDLITSSAAAASEPSQLASVIDIAPAPTTPAPGILLASIARPSVAEPNSPADLGLLGPDSNTSAQPQPTHATPAPAASLLSRDTLRSLERQLAAIQNYSRELVMNMGQERAVELTHLVTTTDTASEVSSISGWKAYAAVVGAAVASVIYKQNEIVRGKKKLDAIFSSKLIHMQAI